MKLELEIELKQDSLVKDADKLGQFLKKAMEYNNEIVEEYECRLLFDGSKKQVAWDNNSMNFEQDFEIDMTGTTPYTNETSTE